jgi:hypothetical protein
MASEGRAVRPNWLATLEALRRERKIYDTQSLILRCSEVRYHGPCGACLPGRGTYSPTKSSRPPIAPHSRRRRMIGVARRCAD